MNNIQTEIGEIVSVNGNNISIQLSDTIKSNISIIEGTVYRIGQVGSFLKIPLGYTNLFGVVTKVGADAAPQDIINDKQIDYSDIQNRQWIGMVLVGEQIGQFFQRGVSQFPTTGDKVHLVTLEDLNIVYGGYDQSSSISIGNISVSSSLDAKVDLDKLVTRHCAILGSTGSGKSNAVGVILKSILKQNFTSSRILILDPHGEYSDMFTDSNVYKVRPESEKTKPFYVPFWALPFDELMSIFPGNLNDSQKSYIRDKVKESKLNTIKTYNNLKIEKNRVTADTPIPFSIKKLWYDLDDFERQTYQEPNKPTSKKACTVQGDVDQMISNEYPIAGIGSSPPFLNNRRHGLLGFLNGLRLRVLDNNYKFLFQPGDYTPDKSGKVKKGLEHLLHNWLGNQEGITILDISGVPSETATSISGTLLKIVYDALFWGQQLPIGGREQPLLIILEEAHSYLKSGEHSISSKIVQTIAKEGRKYGVGLTLITQRPSELDDTVLSQCGTIIALRMNNAKDRGFIKGAIQDELHDLIELLPSLRTGEGIVSGESVKIPSRVQFYKLPYTPVSSDPQVSKKWNEQKQVKIDEYKKLLYNWVHQVFKKGG